MSQTETNVNIEERYEIADLLKLPGEGEVSANGMVYKARARDMGGDFSVMEGVIEPGDLLAPHTHKYEEQMVFVITSELEFEVGGEGGLRFTAPAGGYVQKPRGIMHCFWNATDTPARYIELSGQERFEGYIDSHQRGTVEAQMKAEPDWGLIFHNDQILRCMEQYNLTGLAHTESGDLTELPDLPERLQDLIKNDN